MTDLVVLITGCSSGIGEATAERLAKSGWTVYATARKPGTLRYTVTASAKASIATHRLIGARAWDAAMKSQFPQPKATRD